MSHTLVRYLRKHRWQRRLLTSLIAVIIGGTLGVLLYPRYERRELRLRDEAIIGNLGSADSAKQLAASAKIMVLAEESEDTFDRVVGALAGGNDRQFVAVVAILKSLSRRSPEARARLSGGAAMAQLDAALETDSRSRFTAMVSLLQSLGKFDIPTRKGLHLDHLNAIYMEIERQDANSEHVDGRWTTLREVLTDGRDNRYVRQALALGAGDASADVRKLASILAARLGDASADKVLGSLLADKEPGASAAAALSAAAGGRTGLVDALKKLLDSAADDEVTSATAYALATLDAAGSAERICAMLLDARSSPPLRDRLLHVMTVLNNDPARKAVSSVLGAARRDQRYPPAMALLAAGKLKMTEAEPDIRAVLTTSRKKGKRHTGHLQAAIAAAELLDLSVREELFPLCRDAWGLWDPLTAVSAVRALGRQAAKKQPQHKATREQCVYLLRLAAATGHGHQLWPGRVDPVAAAPIAGTAAAVALWLLDSTECGSKRIRNATHHTDEKKSLPGDYMSWHMAASAPADAMTALGMAMLPPLRGGVHNDQERAAGAMLLALSARTASQKADAVARISLRLKREDKTLISGAYRCALLILGRRGELATVRALRGLRNFPRRRVMTALLAVGDKNTVDWLLLDRNKPLEDVAGLLTTAFIGEVLTAAAPALPAVDLAGDGGMQKWQARIMRHHWGVRRARLALGLRR